MLNYWSQHTLCRSKFLTQSDPMVKSIVIMGSSVLGDITTSAVMLSQYSKHLSY